MKKKINCESAKKIDLLDLLQQLNAVCKRENNNEAWFLSPFRNETKPSFKVSKRLNKWYDHGEGIGGNPIDLITHLKNCSVSSALSFLGEGSFSFQQQKISRGKEEFKYEVLKEQNLQNRALLNYLKSRGISQTIAKTYCFEVYFKCQGKNYFAIAFRNNSGGTELRNKYFKGCKGAKDITTINNNSHTVKIFEGFIDFLTYQDYFSFNSNASDFIICNSTALVRKATPLLKNYNSIEIFFDNDDAGRRGFNFLKSCRTNVIDNSQKYKDFKDLNEFIMNSQPHK
ncbi:CHC2-type zinc finger protein [Christiangramia gaetbulicola]|uniref:CHC2-type zinc finger protein n=1 Tax=Christiangramia gaetbulicola TaxID=703340 RepID=A0A2T6AL04_9FLAO|nr:toprim domain-containing protein [Christiangramia gaetbulicola]PTX44498.1 CHC2-type zinc finger protein [Christiangramia gaetbulicola]